MLIDFCQYLLSSFSVHLYAAGAADEVKPVLWEICQTMLISFYCICPFVERVLEILLTLAKW